MLRNRSLPEAFFFSAPSAAVWCPGSTTTCGAPHGSVSQVAKDPVALDRSKATGSLATWLTLPWGAPQVVVLPGHHTAAEGALKKNASGNDLFLSTCGLMASGVRTILIARWRTGGQSSFDLTREFLQELPHMDPAAAWQRSVQVVSESPLDLEREPRVKNSSAEGSEPKGNHPFFWAGYIVVNSGSITAEAAEAQQAQAPPAPAPADQPAAAR